MTVRRLLETVFNSLLNSSTSPPDAAYALLARAVPATFSSITDSWNFRNISFSVSLDSSSATLAPNCWLFEPIHSFRASTYSASAFVKSFFAETTSLSSSRINFFVDLPLAFASSTALTASPYLVLASATPRAYGSIFCSLIAYIVVWRSNSPCGPNWIIVSITKSWPSSLFKYSAASSPLLISPDNVAVPSLATSYKASLAAFIAISPII